jgi:hypothetical protein
MEKKSKKALTAVETTELLNTLQTRFENNMKRHKDIEWSKVKAKLESNTSKLWSLHQMEATGGEPDVVSYNSKKNEFTFMDCSAESPKGRRSLCYDRDALDDRKEFKPVNNVIDMAVAMGIELLNEQQYRELQQHGDFDLKTSSWIQTPDDIRKLGGALFCDRRYGNIFTYHNGAQSYYAARGFRGCLDV